MSSRSPLPHFPWALKIAFQAGPVETVIRIAGLATRRIGPAVSLVALQRVIQAVSSAADRETLVRSLLFLALTLAVTEIGTSAAKNFDTRLEEKMGPYVQRLVLAKAAQLSVPQFDSPETFDLIDRATRNGGGCAVGLMGDTLFTFASIVGTLSGLVVLARVSPLVAVAAGLAALPPALAGVRQGQRLDDVDRTMTPERRFADYLGALLTAREPAAELRAYDLADHFTARWRASFARLRRVLLAVRRRGTRLSWLSTAISAALFAAALAAVVDLALAGLVSAAEVVVLIGGVRLVQAGMAQTAADFVYIWQFGLPAADLRRFLALPVTVAGGTQPFPDSLDGPIRFEDVSFTYPGSARPVLDRISFTIWPGETVALVGVNGAGKSTLVKLLLGLYRPDCGRITYAGRDVGEFAPASFHRSVACVFQDFTRYELPLADNVALGRPQADAAAVAAACSAAGLAELIAALPDRERTMLGRRFSGGVDLSGGQWQRVALARAFVRDAQLLVLDEPTAALDPRAELEVFGKFAELTRGRTALLISHRLGTARLADRILVLADGRICESGSHDELMAAGGHYAELFRLQANWYQDDPVDWPLSAGTEVAK
ncbi:MAG: ABC transporter ATP-binding protein [Chloroflexota bacterium]